MSLIWHVSNIVRTFLEPDPSQNILDLLKAQKHDSLLPSLSLSLSLSLPLPLALSLFLLSLSFFTLSFID